MLQNRKILMLAGDGIGPEVMNEVKKVIAWMQSNKGIELRKPTNEDIKAGDIVVFTFSHIGIAVKDVDSSGYVVTIEGNTNGAGSREGGSVLEKKRHVSKIRSRIRIL